MDTQTIQIIGAVVTALAGVASTWVGRQAVLAERKRKADTAQRKRKDGADTTDREELRAIYEEMRADDKRIIAALRREVKELRDEVQGLRTEVAICRRTHGGITT